MTNIQQTPDLFDQAIAISISMEGFGRGARKVDMKGVEVDADKDRLALEARILRCKETDAINGLYARVRQAVGDPAKGKALPTFFKRGVFLVPFSSVKELNAELKAFRAELADLVDRLIAVYDTRVAEDALTLREKFSLAHYPKKEELHERFNITWRYLELAPSGRLAAISQEVYDDEVERVRSEVVSMGDEIKRSLRQAALEIIGHMSERLGVDAEGKKKIFRDSMVENLINFLNAFQAKNIMGDTELSSILDQMKALLQNVEPKDLRTNEALRAAVATKVNELVPQLDRLVKSTGVRHIELPEDNDETAAA